MITIGIQGGKGSYNEEACKYLCKVQGVKDFEMKYLYTTESVLAKLHRGKVDYGLFAIEDPLGGIINESIDALTKYTCKIVEKFRYPISHFLLIHQDSKIDDIKTIMTHPQIYKQCKHSLKSKYPDIEVTFGKGKMIDQSRVAEKLESGEIEKNIAIVGSKALAEIYPHLKIVDEELQDVRDIYTTFIFCKRRYIV